MAATTTILSRGDVLAGYRIDDLIGVGGMAMVYRAEQVSLGRRVALKVLTPQLSRDESFRERFRREGKHIAALDHPNVVTIYDSGEADGRLYLAMRLVDGTTLADRMRSPGLSADETMEVLAPIADALDVAHSIGLVHRDVKPQNILLSASGDPYLTDFGVAKMTAATLGLTSTGGFVGSINYASPEQILGELAKSGADIYALSAVLYQCLTGQVPYPRDTDAGVMHAHLHDPPPPLPAPEPQAQALSAVIARGMAKKPEDRYEHAGALLAQAQAAVAQLSVVRRQSVPAFGISVTTGTSEVREAGSTAPAHQPEPPSAGTSKSGQQRPTNTTELVRRDELLIERAAGQLTAADRRRQVPT
ncbi:MAG: serine/threonine-protein kinase, partial [Sciscionella sp.]